MKPYNHGKTVGLVYAKAAEYPRKPPFDPPCRFAELLNVPGDVDPRNSVYTGVRELFHILRLDEARFGAPGWNPLGEFIFPGQTVLLKPNFVSHCHERGWNVFSAITHGSVIRAVLDYVFIALQGTGKVLIADSPLDNADFGEITALCGMEEIVRCFEGNSQLTIDICDLRSQIIEAEQHGGYRLRDADGDPSGYEWVNLGDASEFREIETLSGQFRGSDFFPEQTVAHHQGCHEYSISKSVLSADVVIDIPKLKTHCKAGVTLSLKNTVGIVGDKNCLPHYRTPGPAGKGDEFERYTLWKRLTSMARATAKRHVFSDTKRRSMIIPLMQSVRKKVARWAGIDYSQSGAWYGNDTVWRIIIDLNKILLYYDDRSQKMATRRQRTVFSLVDGIIGGECEGPVKPQPKHTGIIIGGANFVAVDACCAAVMGFGYKRIPHIAKAFDVGDYPLIEEPPSAILCVTSRNGPHSLRDLENSVRSPFKAPKGWKGNIELGSAEKG
jgi:uncharacterized protein (DUF362 family)